ncbi:hypothetical protein [Anatilimnocola floriformis]|uniref:hypothetical protein n=1 Tax=Anatilimnocola floriformis TaxID=2948575 RepID=UPI0020C2F2D4|nr:hypothetical protein [Anatilimnocola floriformis]
MEARPLKLTLVSIQRSVANVLAILSLVLLPAVASAASARSQNFIVTAASKALAVEICEAAETFRRDLAIEWLGAELQPWQQPCPIEAQVNPGLGAGGVTQFSFSRQGTPFGWSMSVQGSKERVLDSVLPHEITHTIFATHFGRPLPRWADEGACTTVEHDVEKRKQDGFLIEFLMTDKGIPFNKMFAMREYPPEMLPLYAQGYSLTRYLIMQGGQRKFVQFVGDGMQSENWPAATRKYYGFKDLSDLQVTWLEWVRIGSPRLQPADSVNNRNDRMIAANAQPASQQNAQQMNQIAQGQPTPSVVASPVAVQPQQYNQQQQPPVQHVNPQTPRNPAHAYVATNAHTPAMRKPSHMQNLEAVSPPRPEFATGSQVEARPTNNLARPYSEGWYAKQRDVSQRPAVAEAPLAAPINSPSQSDLVPVQSAVGSANLPGTAENGTAAAAPLNRRVLLEWSRPVDQPWNPQADGAVAQSGARMNDPTTHRELAADSGGNVLR